MSLLCKEVNQLIETKIVNEQELVGFCPVTNQTPIHKDNFAYCLIQRLAEAGRILFLELGNESYWL